MRARVSAVNVSRSHDRLCSASASRELWRGGRNMRKSRDTDSLALDRLAFYGTCPEFVPYSTVPLSLSLHPLHILSTTLLILLLQRTLLYSCISAQHYLEHPKTSFFIFTFRNCCISSALLKSSFLTLVLDFFSNCSQHPLLLILIFV